MTGTAIECPACHETIKIPYHPNTTKRNYNLEGGYSRLSIHGFLPNLEFVGPPICAICGGMIDDSSKTKRIQSGNHTEAESGLLTIIVSLCEACPPSCLSNYVRIRKEYSLFSGNFLIEIGHPDVAVAYQNSINAHIDALVAAVEQQIKKTWFGKTKLDAARIVMLGKKVNSIKRLKKGDPEWKGLYDNTL